MKALILFALIVVSLALQAQPTRIYVVLNKDAEPVKAYSNDEDYYTFVENRPYFAQEVKLYSQDSVVWKPSDKLLIDDVYYPEELPEKFLAKKTVYVVMQKLNNLADAVFTNLEDCKKYADNWQERYVEVPYFYRNKASYDEVIRLRKKHFE